MVGFKCKKCGRVMYPKHARCTGCRSTDLEEAPLGEKCTLLTYTKLYSVPIGVEQVPVALGIVEFEENGVKATGQLVGEDFETGIKMRPVWGELRKIGEKKIYGFRFEPKEST